VAVKDYMAIKATIFKASLQIADMDRHYCHEHITKGGAPLYSLCAYERSIPELVYYI
jgi:hypothetical protein